MFSVRLHENEVLFELDAIGIFGIVRSVIAGFCAV